MPHRWFVDIGHISLDAKEKGIIFYAVSGIHELLIMNKDQRDQYRDDLYNKYFDGADRDVYLLRWALAALLAIRLVDQLTQFFTQQVLIERVRWRACGQPVDGLVHGILDQHARFLHLLKGHPLLQVVQRKGMAGLQTRDARTR